MWRLYARGVAWQNGELAEGGERESGDDADGGAELWAAALYVALIQLSGGVGSIVPENPTEYV